MSTQSHTNLNRFRIGIAAFAFFLTQLAVSLSSTGMVFAARPADPPGGGETETAADQCPDKDNPAKVESATGSVTISGVTMAWSGDPGQLTLTNSNSTNATVNWCAKGGTNFSGASKNTGLRANTVTPTAPVTVSFGTEVSYFIPYSVTVVPPIDICPATPTIDATVPAGYEIVNGVCQLIPPTDVCPVTPAVDLTVPAGYEIVDGVCQLIEDLCPNIDELQRTVPQGLLQDENGDCVTDECPNIEGTQPEVPEGMAKDEEGNCEDEEDINNKVELCHATGSESNPFEFIEVSAAGAYNGHLGNDHQNGEDIIPPFEYKGTTYSQNYAGNEEFLENGCEESEPTDVCPNIEGLQTVVPVGQVRDDLGDCITPGGRGGDEPLPPQVVVTQAVITFASAPVQPAFGGLGGGAAQLVNTGESTASNLLLSLFVIAMTLTLAGTVRNQQN